MAEIHDQWLSKLGVPMGAFRQASKAQEAGVEVADTAVGGAIDATADAAESVVTAAPVPQGVKDAASTYVGFEKGVAEGIWSGVKDLTGMAQQATDVLDGVALTKGVNTLVNAAIDPNARQDLVK